MQALILVGGRGTRLLPLTAEVPKPAVTLVDRPFLAYSIEWLASHGVDRVVLACGFLSDRLRERLGENTVCGVEVHYLEEPEPLGTAGAIRHAAPLLEERFIALNGDLLTDLDLGALLEFHASRGGRATIGLQAVSDTTGFGVVTVDDAGRVTGFREKPGPDEASAGLVNAGVYVLEREVIERVPEGRAVSIERDVFPELVGEGLLGLALDGYWVDIGTPDRYLEATWDILEGRLDTAVGLSPQGVLIDPGAVVDESARIGPRAVVGPGCRIAKEVTLRESVVLEGSTVGEGALLERAIVAPGMTVGPGEKVVGGIIGKNVADDD